jgi:ParB-like chromosome segregation protein Spo0J
MAQSSVPEVPPSRQLLDEDRRWHPASKIFPLMPDAELNVLAADIEKHGLQNPVVMHEGMVLDGRNRVLACERAAIDCQFVEWSQIANPPETSPIEWVISQNLKRRHLTSSQAAAIAADVLPLIEAQAKERMREGGRTKERQNSASPQDERKSASRIAKQMGTNRTSVAQAKKIKAEDPELLKEVRAGSITVGAASEKLARAGKKDVDRHRAERGPTLPVAPADPTKRLQRALNCLHRVTLRCLQSEGGSALDAPEIADAWILLKEEGFDLRVQGKYPVQSPAQFGTGNGEA